MPAPQQVRPVLAPEQSVGLQPHLGVRDRQASPDTRDPGGQRDDVSMVAQGEPDQDVDVMADATYREAGPRRVAALAGRGNNDR